MAAKNVILKAKIEGVICEIMAKTNATNVYVDDTTKLSTKLADIIADLALKATKSEMTTELAGKADATHTHTQADVTGLEDALTARLTTETMNAAISKAIDDLIDGAPDTYNTLKEISDYIATHASVETTLLEAIGKKADKTTVEALQTTVNGLGALALKDQISESDLTDELKLKVNAASEGNHSHLNKELLDTYDQTNANIKDAVEKKHSHANKTTLDKLTEDHLIALGNKSSIYYSASQPEGLTEKDLWVQEVE